MLREAVAGLPYRKRRICVCAFLTLGNQRYLCDFSCIGGHVVERAFLKEFFVRIITRRAGEIV